MSPATNGRLRVIGTGPGPAHWMTPETAAILDEATDLVGYGPYLARCPDRPGQSRHGSDNRVELDRARLALRLAVEGRDVAVVSGGDPGVFAMAAAVMEAIETGEPAWRALPVSVHPGVSAMQAAAAAVGAPLGADFCAISLSDNLKPWDVVVHRLRKAIEADFVVSLYNPASLARPRKIHEAFARLADLVEPERVVILARAVGRPDQKIVLTTFAGADLDRVDMATCVVIGNSETRVVERPDGLPPFVYSPRSVGSAETGR